MRKTVIKCKLCGNEVYMLRSVTNPAVSLLVDIEATPDGRVSINEMLGTYAVVPRPGRKALREDLHTMHAKTCPVLLTRRSRFVKEEKGEGNG